jgi:voltage-gated potassium channel Kch
MYKRLENVVLLTFAALALGLGFWGYAIAGSDYSPPTGHPVNPFTWLEGVRCLISAIGLIRCVDLFQPLKDPWQLVVAQFAVPGVALLTAAQIFLVSLRKDIRTALARHTINHTIVCGVGDVGMQVIQNLRGAGNHVVAIDLVNDSPNAATCEKCRVPVLQGDAKNPQVLLASGVRRADTVIVCTGSDAENMDVALQVKSLLSARSYRLPRKIQVLTQLRNEWLYKKLINTDKKSLGSANVDLRLFNPFTNAARMLIKRLRLPPSPEYDAGTFVVIGFGAYGREATLHLIRAALVGLNSNLNILVIDQKADLLKEKFLVKNPAAAELASLNFVTASVVPGSPDIKNIVEEKLRSAGPLLGVAIALGEDEVSLCAALEIRSLLDRMERLRVPVYVRLEHYRQLGELVSNVESICRFNDRLQVFGTLEEILSPGVLFGSRLDALAQALHEDYRRRSQENINQQANVPWHELPEFMKMSNRWRADHTPLLLALAGFHVEEDVKSPVVLELTAEETELLAQLEHRRFTIERRLVDWMSGESRRHLQRKHPHLADWSMLEEEQRDWNRKEVAKLPRLLAGLGVELRRERKIRAYGAALATAAAELDSILAGPQSAHYVLVVDLDEPQARSIAERALSLHSVSFWLFSREEPREFFQRQSRESSSGMQAVIERAEGWIPREQVAMRES